MSFSRVLGKPFFFGSRQPTTPEVDGRAGSKKKKKKKKKGSYRRGSWVNRCMCVCVFDMHACTCVWRCSCFLVYVCICIWVVWRHVALKNDLLFSYRPSRKKNGDFRAPQNGRAGGREPKKKASLTLFLCCLVLRKAGNKLVLPCEGLAPRQANSWRRGQLSPMRWEVCMCVFGNNNGKHMMTSIGKNILWTPCLYSFTTEQNGSCAYCSTGNIRCSGVNDCKILWCRSEFTSEFGNFQRIS